MAGGPTIHRRAFLTLGSMRGNGRGTQNSDKAPEEYTKYLSNKDMYQHK